jgi:predicted ATP-grasp superfamily ATP-dependent carboligase
MTVNGFAEYIPKVYDDYVFPCIVKHNKSWYGRSTYIVNSPRDIPKEINLDEYSICEIIEGKTEYATHIFANNGEILMDLTIQHSFDKPIFVHGVTKKPMSSHEIPTNSSSLNVFKEIVKTSGYSGIMCVDYKIVNNIPKIFEINPRVGGSLTRSNAFHSFIDKYIQVCA